MTNNKTTTPVAETKTVDPVVATPVVETAKTVETTPVVETVESTTNETPAFSSKLIVKLASEIKNAESDTNAVTLGSKNLGSKDQSSRQGTHRGIEIKLIKAYKTPESELYKVGDIDPTDSDKTLEKGNELLGKPNAIAQQNIARIELLNKEYDSPKESYSNEAIQAMVFSGVLLRAANLIYKAYSDSGIADMVFGLHLVRRIAKWDTADRDALYSEFKLMSVSGQSLAKIDRSKIESFVDSKYALLAEFHGFNPIEKASAKSNGDKLEVSLDDLLTMDLSNQVTDKSKSEKASQSQGKKTGQSKNAPTGKEFNPATITAAAKAGKPETIQATPPLVSSTSEKTENENTVKPVESNPVPEVKTNEPEVKPDEKKTEPEAVKPTGEEKKPAETK